MYGNLKAQAKTRVFHVILPGFAQTKAGAQGGRFAVFCFLYSCQNEFADRVAVLPCFASAFLLKFYELQLEVIR